MQKSRYVRVCCSTIHLYKVAFAMCYVNLGLLVWFPWLSEASLPWRRKGSRARHFPKIVMPCSAVSSSDEWYKPRENGHGMITQVVAIPKWTLAFTDYMFVGFEGISSTCISRRSLYDDMSMRSNLNHGWMWIGFQMHMPRVLRQWRIPSGKVKLVLRLWIESIRKLQLLYCIF